MNFIPTPTQLLWEAFTHTAITTSEDYSLTFPPPSYIQVLIYSFIQLSGPRRRDENENDQILKR